MKQLSIEEIEADQARPQAMKYSPKLITVCDKCLQASCWQGIFMCDESRSAGIVQKTRRQLRKLAREHPSYWKTDAQLITPCTP